MNQTFKVSGMTSEECVHAVQKAVLRIDSTAKIQVDMPTGHVSIASIRPHSVIQAAIEDAGYKVSGA